MAIVYNDRIISGPAWCGACDRPRDECRCEAWAAEEAHEALYPRLDVILRGRRHPLRKSYVKLRRAMFKFYSI